MERAQKHATEGLLCTAAGRRENGNCSRPTGLMDQMRIPAPVADPVHVITAEGTAPGSYETTTSSNNSIGGLQASAIHPNTSAMSSKFAWK